MNGPIFYSPTGPWVMFAAEYGGHEEMRAVNVATGRRLPMLDESKGYAVAISPNGRELVQTEVSPTNTNSILPDTQVHVVQIAKLGKF